MTEERTDFWSRLATARSQMGRVSHDRENAYLKYTYPSYGALVEAAQPALTEAGIAIVQYVQTTLDPPTVSVETVLRDDDTEYRTGPVMLPVLAQQRGEINAQAFGAAISYARRYSLSVAIGIGEDDSIDQAAPPTSTPQPPRQPAQNGDGWPSTFQALQSWGRIGGEKRKAKFAERLGLSDAPTSSEILEGLHREGVNPTMPDILAWWETMERMENLQSWDD